MKPGRSTSPVREITTVEPSSNSISRTDWEPEPHQIPITQPEPGPEKIPTEQPASKTQQGLNTQQEPASQQRPPTQQAPLAQHEAESQQEPRGQQKSALQQELLAPQEPAPQQSPPIQRVSLTQQQGPGPEKESRTQQEPELEEGCIEPPLAQQEAGVTPPAGTESTSQEKPEQSDPIVQQTAPAKSSHRSLNEWGFLSKLRELSIQQPMASEWKAFLEWVTDFDPESDSEHPSETNSVAQKMKLAFKWKPGSETMSGYGATPASRKKTNSHNHRHYSDSGELSLEEQEPPRDGHS